MRVWRRNRKECEHGRQQTGPFNEPPVTYLDPWARKPTRATDFLLPWCYVEQSQIWQWWRCLGTKVGHNLPEARNCTSNSSWASMLTGTLGLPFGCMSRSTNGILVCGVRNPGHLVSLKLLNLFSLPIYHLALNTWTSWFASSLLDVYPFLLITPSQWASLEQQVHMGSVMAASWMAGMAHLSYCIIYKFGPFICNKRNRLSASKRCTAHCKAQTSVHWLNGV